MNWRKGEKQKKALQSPRLCLSLGNKRDPAQGWLVRNAASLGLGYSGQGGVGDGRWFPISDHVDQSGSIGPKVAVRESQAKDPT